MSVYRQGRRPDNSCPRCMEALVPVERRAGVQVCEKCGGVFADMATTNRIVETLDRELLALGFETSLGKQKPRDDGQLLTCPECQIEMEKRRIESAACDIDGCPVHGTWFDSSELVDVMRALERARKHGVIFTHNRPSLSVNLPPTSPKPEPAPEPEPAPPRTLLDSILAWLD